MFKNFEDLKNKLLNGKSKKIVVSNADLESIKAIKEAHENLGISYIFVGNKEEIKNICNEINLNVIDENIVHTNSKEESAKKSVEIVKNGLADILMKGKIDTSTLLKAVVDKENGINNGTIMSHLTVLENPVYHKLLFITDAGMNIYPNLEQKKYIIKNAIDYLKILGYKNIKIGVMAAIETVNPKMPETEDAQNLVDLFKKENVEGCIIEGPISLDIAISEKSAKTKGSKSEIAGDIDIMVMPNIACGNIMSKSLVYLGNTIMAGIILGAKAPIVLTSRGASSQEKLMSILLTMVYSN
ncbi:MAG: phosphate acyltransferase [Defluviitaleaceae bacterium]|nr:phosphate acyltransferase [Defluviitaleaceae bacterium]